eukprot:TRINITY_DN743_c0_g1_i22.p1 TRINITY_DN743_c0_g1~~TRINITY_DN743_c0_g1_i22.p1  ORF type:complete len:304 (+),score=61.40 TRINITY_DN743_c0_g1_i22:156-1067(+)
MNKDFLDLVLTEAQSASTIDRSSVLSFQSGNSTEIVLNQLIMDYLQKHKFFHSLSSFKNEARLDNSRVQAFLNGQSRCFLADAWNEFWSKFAFRAINGNMSDSSTGDSLALNFLKNKELKPIVYPEGFSNGGVYHPPSMAETQIQKNSDNGNVKSEKLTGLRKKSATAKELEQSDDSSKSDSEGGPRKKKTKTQLYELSKKIAKKQMIKMQENQKLADAGYTSQPLPPQIPSESPGFMQGLNSMNSLNSLGLGEGLVGEQRGLPTTSPFQSSENLLLMQTRIEQNGETQYTAHIHVVYFMLLV